MAARTALLALLLALLGAEPAAAAAREWVSVAAPARAKAARAFSLSAAVKFDKRRYAPPRAYLSAGVWRHRGDDPCPGGVPIARRGWQQVGAYDFRPLGTKVDDLATEFLAERVTLARRGAYRHCAYAYAIRYRATSSRPTYDVLARDGALTRVG